MAAPARASAQIPDVVSAHILCGSRDHLAFDVPLYDFVTNGMVLADHYTQTNHIFVAGARMS